MAKIIKRAAANAAKAERAPVDELARDPELTEALRILEPVIEIRPLDELKANPRNARRHGERQIELLAANVKKFGFIGAIIVDEEGVILAGHARFEAARRTGLRVIPTIRVTHLSPELKRAFVLADNRLAELAEWDEELLADELLELSALELDFDIEITGFDTVDIDRLEAVIGEQLPQQEVVPELDREQPAVSAPGDLWQLGRHRLFCGSALDEESYRQLLGDERAQLVFTDPPYNVKIDGHVCGLGSVRHRESKWPRARCPTLSSRSSWAG